MAVGQNASVNPFDEQSEDDEIKTDTASNAVQDTNAKNSAVSPFPFIKVIIVIACSTLVFILLIAGTATTAIAFPPKKTPKNDESKLLGPLLLTAGCFLFCVNVALCFILVRDSYHSSKGITKFSLNAWNNNSVRPLPVSFVGGPFFIATTDPTMAHPSFMPMDFSRPGWVHPDAPLVSPTPDGFNKMSAVRPQTATLSRATQPPYNPDIADSANAG